MTVQVKDLIAEVRAGSGKGAARQARRDGKVPGVVYGDNKEPVALNLNYNYLLKFLKQGRFLSTLFNLKVEGQDDARVICRGVQRDVVRDLPTHIDFLRVGDDTRINLFITLNFINADQAPGIKKGGSLSVIQADVELEVAAGNIPAEVTVDLTGKKIGETINIADIELPAGAKVANGRNFAIATIAASTALAAADDEEEAA